MNTVPAEITHQALLDAISITATGLAVLNAEKVVVFHNKHFAKMFGFGDQSLTGQHVNEITRLLCSSEIKSMGGEAIPIQEWLNTVIKKISTNQGEPFDIKLTNGNCLSISGQSQSNGNLVIACADITLQKQTELALHNAKQELQRLALTDELTGVSNRQYFMQQLEREINRSSRTHHPLCLAMVDIDFLKNINDNFGHAIGDKILMHFSQFLQTHFRASDIVGRLSSEEFAILLPETKINDALHVVDRAINSLTNEKLSDIQYSFSAGLATFPDNLPIDSNWLLTQADKALSLAKSTGRGKAVMA